MIRKRGRDGVRYAEVVSGTVTGSALCPCPFPFTGPRFPVGGGSLENLFKIQSGRRGLKSINLFSFRIILDKEIERNVFVI